MSDDARNLEKHPTKIALFANHLPGLKVAQYLAKRSPEDIVGALYLTGKQAENDKNILDSLNLDRAKVFTGPEAVKSQAHIEWFKSQKFDALVSVYWPWLLKKEIFSSVPVTVNFHPAFLPINRGWFPHVHSLLDGSKTGVTLHKIEEGADTGAIWVQKEVVVEPTDTAKEIYERLQREIVELFKASWPEIEKNTIIATAQDESVAVYHAKKEIETLDFVDLNKTYKARDLINLLRARSFGGRGFAYYEVDSKRVFVKICLSETNKFD